MAQIRPSPLMPAVVTTTARAWTTSADPLSDANMRRPQSQTAERTLTPADASIERHLTPAIRELQWGHSRLLCTYGVLFGKSVGGFARRIDEILAEELDALPLIRDVIVALSRARFALVEQIKRRDRQVASVAKANSTGRLFITTPGVGPITALSAFPSSGSYGDVGIKAHPGEPHRLKAVDLPRSRAVLPVNAVGERALYAWATGSGAGKDVAGVEIGVVDGSERLVAGLDLEYA
jgi:hypothetical protein